MMDLGGAPDADAAFDGAGGELAALLDQACGAGAKAAARNCELLLGSGRKKVAVADLELGGRKASLATVANRSRDGNVLVDRDGHVVFLLVNDWCFYCFDLMLSLRRTQSGELACDVLSKAKQRQAACCSLDGEPQRSLRKPCMAVALASQTAKHFRLLPGQIFDLDAHCAKFQTRLGLQPFVLLLRHVPCRTVESFRDSPTCALQRRSLCISCTCSGAHPPSLSAYRTRSTAFHTGT